MSSTKYLLIILITFTSLTVKAQTSAYHAFPEDSASWVTDFYYNTCFGYCGSTYYELKGDTIINGQSYNKIFARYGEFYYITTPPNSVIGGDFNACSYTGAIRQDSINKKVYYTDSTMTSDTLLFDFNLAIGDTIQDWYNRSYMQWPLVVSAIDSISINGNYHKQFHFQNTLNDQNLIEGVGWTGELFGISPSAVTSYLACFNGNIIIQEAFVNECATRLDCSIYLGVNELNQQNNFSHSPNPFSEKITFTLENNESSELFIYDLASRKIMQKQFINSISVNTEQLAKGLYIYEVRSKHDFRRQGKVVKE